MAKNKKKIYQPHHVNRCQSSYYLLLHEKKELEAHYDFLDCQFKSIKGRLTLIVTGTYSQTGVNYTYKVIYNGVEPPKVWILSPTIVNDPPHVYKDKSLCLYYPPEQHWRFGASCLYSHIIPWVHEWILFYEIWLIIGKWEHPEVDHRLDPLTFNDKN